MDNQALEQLIDKWMNDVSFREEVRQNPFAAVERTGIVLTEEDKAVLQTIDWNLPDEELQARVSKA